MRHYKQETQQAMRYYYTYRIDFADGDYYYGSRISKVLPEQDIYWGSPKTHKEKWLTTMYWKTILSVYDTKDEMLLEENNLIGDKHKTDPKCLNQHNNGNFSTAGMKYSDESKKKMSDKKQGYVPWMTGKEHKKETKEHWSRVRKGRRFTTKVTKDDVIRIRELYEYSPALPGSVGVVQRNGKVLPYDVIFSKTFHEMFGLTDKGLLNIIRRKSWTDV